MKTTSRLGKIAGLAICVRETHVSLCLVAALLVLLVGCGSEEPPRPDGEDRSSNAETPTASRKEPTTDRLYQIMVNGKHGVMDQAGNVVIAPKYDSGIYFSDGRARIEKEDRYGYIDRQEKIVIAPQFRQADPFSEGMAAVQMMDGAFGYIDPSGAFVIKPNAKWTAAGPFREGRAAVRVDGEYGFIDRTGTLVVKPTYEDVRPFAQGRAAVLSNASWGYIDLAGKVVVPLQFVQCSPFSDGLAAVKVLPPGATTDPNKTPIAVIMNSKWGYIDRAGNLVIPAQFVSAGAFGEGMAAVGDHTAPRRRVGYIDKKGKFVIPPRFDGGQPFSEGMAAANVGDPGAYEPNSMPRLGGAWGYIDKSGKWVIAPKYSWATQYEDGVAGVLVAVDPNPGPHAFPAVHEAGYIDTKGKWVWKPTR